MNTTQLLEIATQKLPPEILRIIASKYRRNYDIKSVLCSNARSIQPKYKNEYEYCYEIDDWKYILYKPSCNYQFKWHYRIKIYKKQKLIAEVHHFSNVNTFLCTLYEKISVRILYRALVLFKRHEIQVDGDSRIRIFKKHIQICSLMPIRYVLYEINPSIWKKEEPLRITLCTIM